MSRFTPPLKTRLRDPEAEEVRRNHEQRLSELLELPCVRLKSLGEFELEDGVPKTIAHGLDRKPEQIIISPPRGSSLTAGLVQEIREAAFNRAKVIVLKASDFGATVRVDVSVL